MVTRGRQGNLLAQEHLTIPVGSFKTWTLPPNQATKRLLRKLGSLRIALTITARRASLVTTPTDGILFPQPFHKTLVLKSHAA
jgi:hypothetical protein